MANQVKVKVLRQLNNGEFNPGDVRTMDVADAERLASTGAVAIIGAKAAQQHKNKMERAAANKVSGPRKTKGS